MQDRWYPGFYISIFCNTTCGSTLHLVGTQLETDKAPNMDGPLRIRRNKLIFICMIEYVRNISNLH